MATKSYHPHPLHLPDNFSTACFMSERFMIFKQFFSPSQRRGGDKQDSPAVWQLHQILAGISVGEDRGWISMTMGRKMKAGSISSEAFISNMNGTVTKNETRSTVHLQGNNEALFPTKKLFRYLWCHSGPSFTLQDYIRQNYSCKWHYQCIWSYNKTDISAAAW